MNAAILITVAVAVIAAVVRRARFILFLQSNALTTNASINSNAALIRNFLNLQKTDSMEPVFCAILSKWNHLNFNTCRQQEIFFQFDDQLLDKPDQHLLQFLDLCHNFGAGHFAKRGIFFGIAGANNLRRRAEVFSFIRRNTKSRR